MKCKLCDSVLVQRTNSKTGVRFLGCSAFPRCRFTSSTLNSIAGRGSNVENDVDDAPPSLNELAQDWGWDSWSHFSDSIE